MKESLLGIDFTMFSFTHTAFQHPLMSNTAHGELFDVLHMNPFLFILPSAILIGQLHSQSLINSPRENPKYLCFGTVYC